MTPDGSKPLQLKDSSLNGIKDQEGFESVKRKSIDTISNDQKTSNERGNHIL